MSKTESLTSALAASSSKGVQKLYTKLRHKIGDNFITHHSSSRNSKRCKGTNNAKETVPVTVPTVIASTSALGNVSKVPNGENSANESNFKRTQGMLKHQRISNKARNNKEAVNPREKPSSSSSSPTLSTLENASMNKASAKSKNTPIITTATATNTTSTYVDSDDEYQFNVTTKSSLEDEIFKELEKVAHDETKLQAVLKNFDNILTEYNSSCVANEGSAANKCDNRINKNTADTEQLQSERQARAAHHQETLKVVTIERRISRLNTQLKIIKNPELKNWKSCSNILEKCSYLSGFNLTRHFKSLNNVFTGIKSSKTGVNTLFKKPPNVSSTANKVVEMNTAESAQKSFNVKSLLARRLRSKSSWDLAMDGVGPASKIPINKTAALKKRSSSLCDFKVIDSNKSTISHYFTFRHSQNCLQPFSSTANKTPKINTDPTTRRKVNQLKLSQHKSTPTATKKALMRYVAKKSPVSVVQVNRQNSDILLDKCLEKGHDILRKVEAMQSDVAHVRSNNSPFKKSKSFTRKTKPKLNLKTLNYADDAQVHTPPLESCKIIPPIIGETSPANAKLLVNVVQIKPANTAPKQCDDNDCKTIQSLPTSHLPTQPTEKINDADSDDSGHISNDNDNESNQSRSSSKEAGSKIAQLLRKFEKFENPPKASSTLGQNTKPPIKQCISTVKVAKLEPVQCIHTQIEIYPTYSKEIFFRSGVLCELEAKRDVLLSDRIIQFQACCRGFLARKQIARRRVQEIAVRCIQRNVKSFLAVRDWPWWRLLVRVTPLLNVHRTEEQLKVANDELMTLRNKLEKIENERNLLKSDNQKLEAKLSEMTIDLTEERSSANINAERLEVETAERLKLEKELEDQQNKVKNLQETTEKLEMELICAKSDLNGVSEDEDHDNDESVGGVYKLKYERVARELEFTKRRLQTQHEHDLEQLVGLKKQLEKKLADAYEEVEEQRQVVGQWKRKTQKMTNEMNDLRMLLEEQNVRNNMLEKKQRKFDSECQALQDATRQERQAKDRLSREMDVLIAEKFGLEQSLADTRLDLELKEEKLASLQRELEEMTFGVGTEEEIAQLRRNKNELDRRVKEQDEELDEMAGQVQLLEQAKLRLEMALETMRKESRREAQQRDEELEEARGVAYKKIKALECQLETEHEERTLLLREKHELERRLAAIEDQERTDRQAEEVANQKLRRDVRKYKALLKDCQAQLERLKADTPGKTLVRQLRNQLEDAESARTLAMKARQAADAELAELQAMFEEANRARNDAEDRAIAAQRDRTELQAQIEENEEELAELMKKYSSTVKQLNTEQIAASEYEFKLSELEAERNNLKDQVSELQQRLENIENLADPSAAMMSKRLELRSKELESRLELEQATRTRLEVQVTRHKESVEKLQQELTQAKIREKQAQDNLKKSQKTLRDVREEFHVVTGREQESILRRKDLEKKLEQAESDGTSLKNDLRLALQRIADLQQAMEEEVDDEDDAATESEESNDSDVGSLVDLEERLRPIQFKRSTTSSGSVNNIQAGNGTKLLIREKDENSPRITLTSPSSTQINKVAAAAKTTSEKSQTKHTNSENLNGDTSFA